MAMMEEEEKKGRKEGWMDVEMAAGAARRVGGNLIES